MPSTFAHKVFGDMVLKKLPEGIRPGGQRLRLYMIGLHGPDILFYYKGLKPNEVNAIGYGQHGKPAADFFGPGAEVFHSEENHSRRELDRAYLIGFVCHFVLDAACHGYIEKKIKVSGVPHTEIETEFDRYLMVKRGLDPVRKKLTGHIHPTMANSRTIAPFFPPLTQEEVFEALNSMIFYNRLLIAPKKPKRRLIHSLLRATGNYEEMHGMMVNLEPNPLCSDSNLRLEKLMDSALDPCLDMIRKYMDTLDNGAPLPDGMDRTFGPGPGWEDIPVLTYEEEEKYEL